MKKCLISLALSLLLGSSLVSAELVKRTLPLPSPVGKADCAHSRAATEDGYQLRFCDDLDSWATFTDQANTTYKCYIVIPPEIATSLAGNKLTDISFSIAMQTGSSKAGSVFVSENLDADPVVSQDVKIKNGYGTQNPTQTVALDEPYTIKEGVGFAFGYVVTKCSSGVYPVGYDQGPSNQFAGYVDVYTSSGSYMGSVSMNDDVNTNNLYLYANTVGEKHGLYDVFSVSSLSMGDFSLPVVDASKGIVGVNCKINNIGSNPVTSVGYSYSVNGGNLVEGVLDTDVAGGSIGDVSIPVAVENPGRGNVTVSVSSINGMACDATADLSFLALDNEGFDRKFVVEEGTGTWCGYCPAGIVGMEHMAAAYPDKFIGIAVHSGDNMEVDSYSPFVGSYFEGFPSAVVNRDRIFDIYPDPETLEFVYGVWLNQPAAVDVDMVVTKPVEDAKSMNVATSTVFAFDEAAADYAIAFVITEDGLKGVQNNNYSGSNYNVGGWENKPAKVSWTYTDTARDIFGVWGINGSVPSSVEKGLPYEYSYNLNLSHVKNIENTSVIALVLDKATGTIMNAKKVKYADYTEPSAISSVSIDPSAPAEYYNIQGVRMDGDNLPAGLYIIRQGDKVQKTIIR